MLPVVVRKLFPILGMVGLLVIFNEYLIYYVKITTQCAWPNQLAGGGDSVLRAMILADIHMLGPRHGHWADKLRREWQMHRAFQTAVTWHRPDVVFILGDLFDEGQTVNAAAFNDYVLRFQKLFHVPDGVKVFGALGNHDVGFHYWMIPYLVNRFQRKVFKNPSNTLITMKGVNFVIINSMAMEADGCDLCKDAERDLKRIAQRLKCARGIDMDNGGASSMRGTCPNVTDTAHGSKPILLQHFPTYRASDANCTERDAMPLEKYRSKWDVLSKRSTDWLGKLLAPRVVFSGHSHRYCRSMTRWGVEEHTVSSFNWRNNNNPKFLLVEFTTDDSAVEVCEVPHESTVVAIYTFGTLATVIVVILLEFRRILRNAYVRVCSVIMIRREKPNAGKVIKAM